MAENKTRQRIWEFGPFRLDEAERLLLRNGGPVGLTPKVFDTLLVLLERSGHLIEKDELMARLWPDTFVEESALTRNISDLRKALGGERYVETVPKRGYRFVAPVREVAAEGSTLIVEKTTEAQLVIEEEETPTALPLPARQTRLARQRKIRLAVLLVAGVLITFGLLSLARLLRYQSASDETRRVFQAMQVRRFTAAGNVLTAALSPDGKYVATVLDEAGLQSLWLRQVAANTSSVQLLAPALVEYWGLTFSHDSNFIYYVSWVRNQPDAELYQLPVLGGTPRKVPTLTDTPISFSPAGDRFTYMVSSSSKGEAYVKTVSAAGGAGETLVKRRQPGFFAAWPGGPAWSPDGKFIAYAASGTGADDIRHMRVFVTNVEDKTERQLSQQSWGEIGRVAWLGDGSGLVISAREEKDGPRQLWFVAYPDGAARKISNDLNDYDSVSVSGADQSLAAVLTQSTFSISVTPQGAQAKPDLTQTREIFAEVGSGRERIAWTPDNRLVYSSRASGNWDLWIMNKDGSGQRQLTVDAHNDLLPAVSADGRYIFFSSDRAGALNIWRMEIDGGKQVGPTQLTRGANQIFPEVTPDGQWVIYQQGLGLDEPSLWRVAATGGAAEQLADGSALQQRPAIAPDGRSLAYVYLDDKGWGLAVRALEDNAASRKFSFPANVKSRAFRWTPDGQALAYIVNEKGAANIWLQPLSGAPPSPLTDFKAGQLLTFAWSRDGQWLAYVRQSATSDVVLLRDFK